MLSQHKCRPDMSSCCVSSRNCLHIQTLAEVGKKWNLLVQYSLTLCIFPKTTFLCLPRRNGEQGEKNSFLARTNAEKAADGSLYIQSQRGNEGENLHETARNSCPFSTSARSLSN